MRRKKESRVTISKKLMSDGDILYSVGIVDEGHNFYTDKQEAIKAYNFLKSCEADNGELDMDRIKRLYF